MQAIYNMLGVSSAVEFWWVSFGLFGQLLFSARFIVQWIASEHEKSSVIPLAFWYLSLSGGIVLFCYALYRQDIVFILGQSLGVFIYSRNLWLIHRSPKSERLTKTDKE